MAAAIRVLDTTELLENILLHLTFRQTILTAPRVCRTWQKVINNSPALRRKVFTDDLPIALENVDFRPKKPHLLLFGFSDIKSHTWDMKRVHLPNGNHVFLVRERSKEFWAFKSADPEEKWIFLGGEVNGAGMSRGGRSGNAHHVVWKNARGVVVEECWVEERAHPLWEYLNMWYF